jgi:cyanophycinase-like exopeptidase
MLAGRRMQMGRYVCHGCVVGGQCVCCVVFALAAMMVAYERCVSEQYHNAPFVSDRQQVALRVECIIHKHMGNRRREGLIPFRRRASICIEFDRLIRWCI